MRQGIQTGFKNADLRGYGCYFFVLAEWACRAFNKDFTDDEIIAAYQYCLDQGWIFTGKDDKGIQWTCLIKNPVKIFNFLADKPDYFRSFRHENSPPNTIRFPVYFEKNSPSGFDHFALGQLVNGKVKIIWDSWTPSALNRGLKITSYRSFA